jgi:hypothetical protein
MGFVWRPAVILNPNRLLYYHHNQNLPIIGPRAVLKSGLPRRALRVSLLRLSLVVMVDGLALKFFGSPLPTLLTRIYRSLAHGSTSTRHSVHYSDKTRFARPLPAAILALKDTIIGTSSIVHEVTHQPLLSTLSGVVETVVNLRKLGHKVILVTSGAIGVGLRRMDMPAKPKSLSGKQVSIVARLRHARLHTCTHSRQAVAAIGQGRLIALWDNLFSQLEQPIAQVLLTRGDISDVCTDIVLLLRRLTMF